MLPTAVRPPGPPLSAAEAAPAPARGDEPEPAVKKKPGPVPVPPKAPPPRHLIKDQLVKAADHAARAAFLVQIARYAKEYSLRPEDDEALRALPAEVARSLMISADSFVGISCVTPVAVRIQPRIRAAVAAHRLSITPPVGTPACGASAKPPAHATFELHAAAAANGMHTLKQEDGVQQASLESLARGSMRPSHASQRIVDKIQERRHVSQIRESICQFVHKNNMGELIEHALLMLAEKDVLAFVKTTFRPTSPAEQREKSVLEFVKVKDMEASLLVEILRDNGLTRPYPFSTASIAASVGVGSTGAANPWMPVPGAGFNPWMAAYSPWMMPGMIPPERKKKKHKKEKGSDSEERKGTDRKSKGKRHKARSSSRSSPTRESRESRAPQRPAYAAAKSRGPGPSPAPAAPRAPAAAARHEAQAAKLEALLSAIDATAGSSEESDYAIRGGDGAARGGRGGSTPGRQEESAKAKDIALRSGHANVGRREEIGGAEDAWEEAGWAPAELGGAEGGPDAGLSSDGMDGREGICGAARPAGERERVLYDWLLEQDGGRGAMLRYFDPLMLEFDGDFAQIAAAKLSRPIAPGVVGFIDPTFWEACGVTSLGHRLLLAGAIAKLPT